LYSFLGEPWFDHDFDKVEYEADEFWPSARRTCTRYGARSGGERTTVLPPELFERFADDAFWTAPEVNTRNVRVILYQD
jgi:sulfotransferase